MEWSFLSNLQRQKESKNNWLGIQTQINVVISLQRVLMKLKGKGAVIVEITSL
jgi:hypothetical protein